MSLSVDGVWKAGVWASTAWADGVWFEGAQVAVNPALKRRHMIVNTGRMMG